MKEQIRELLTTNSFDEFLKTKKKYHYSTISDERIFLIEAICQFSKINIDEAKKDYQYYLRGLQKRNPSILEDIKGLNRQLKLW